MSTMRKNGEGWQILDGTSCKDVKSMQNSAPVTSIQVVLTGGINMDAIR